MADNPTKEIQAGSAKPDQLPGRFQQTKLAFTSLSQRSQKQKVEDIHNALPGRTITRTNARQQYHISNDDLDILHCVKKQIRAKDGSKEHVMQLFQEQDVERRAWDRHGGKQQYVNYLKMLLRNYERRKGSRGKQSFKVPDAYRREVLGLLAPARVPGPSQARPAENIPSSPILEQIKNSMAPWLWDRLTAALSAWDAKPKDSDKNGLTIEARERAMRSAAKFAARYPARPPTTDAPAKSPWMAALRTVLADAPRIPPAYSVGCIDGMVFQTHKTFGELFQWDGAYLRRVFVALNDVLKAHGLGAEGWAGVRWEIYDAYMDSVEARFAYDRVRDEWYDQGAHWLTDAYRFNGLKKYCSKPGTRASPRARVPKVPSPTHRSVAGASSM